MSFTTSIQLENDSIIVKITDSQPGNEYAFYLYWYPNQSTPKQTVIEQGYTKSNKMVFKPEKSGYYLARCFVQNNLKRNDKYTETVLFINNDSRKEFEQKMNSNLVTVNTITEPIEYFKVPSPQNDFCLISQKKGSNKIKDSLKKWTKENGFEMRYMDQYNTWNTENILIYNSSKEQQGMANDYIFSGYIWKDDKFYFGQNDIPDNIKGEELYEKLGMYTIISCEKDKIKITEDFYGYGGLYYYESEDIFVVANVYHLLLFILSNLNNKYEIDNEQIYTMFASNVTLFRQPLSSRLLIKDTYYINLCDEIIVDREGWHIVKRPSYDILTGSCEFIEEKYNELIRESRDEIINNVKAALKNDRFNKYILELSGGKDSRTTFAAITNIEDSNKQLKIISTDHEPNDLDTAVGLVNMFGYDFSKYGNVFYMDDILDNIKRKRSYSCGIRWLWYVETRHEHDLSKLILNGDSFESLCVRYYSKTVLDKVGTNPTQEELLSTYSEMLSRQAIINYSSKSEIINKNILEGMNQIPGSTPIEKFDNMFMFYRGRIHAGTMDRMFYSAGTANPLQAKSLLLAKKMWINNFKDEKIIFDINYALNPVLAMLPYNTNRYNETREKMRDKIWYEDVRFKNFKAILDTDRTKWEEAEREREKNSTVKYDSGYINRGRVEDVVFENCIFGIKSLSKIMNGKYKYDICMPLYYYVNQEKRDDVEIRITHNKINSILDCIDAIGKENFLEQ